MSQHFTSPIGRGNTLPDGSARPEYHAKPRDWAFRNRGKQAPVGVDKRERRRVPDGHKVEFRRDGADVRAVIVHKYPPELQQAARRLGMSCEKLLGLLELQRRHGK